MILLPCSMLPTSAFLSNMKIERNREPHIYIYIHIDIYTGKYIEIYFPTTGRLRKFSYHHTCQVAAWFLDHPFFSLAVGWVSSCHPQDERALPHWSLAKRVAVELQRQLSQGRASNAQVGMEWWSLVCPSRVSLDMIGKMDEHFFQFFFWGRTSRYGSTGLVDLLASYVSLLEGS